MTIGSIDPLRTARVVALLERNLHEGRLTASVSSDFAEFAKVRNHLRGGQLVSPLFDPDATTLAADRSFWMSLRDDNDEIVGLQAFRLDRADPNLAEWALGWILGIYLKRSELIVPADINPSATSLTRHVAGRTAYQGEVWIAESRRGNGLLEEFSRFGIILAFLKWQPEAVWALTTEAMAKRGATLRMGYPHSERGFLRWEFLPEGADATEWISIADGSAIQRLIAELEVTLPQCRRAQPWIPPLLPKDRLETISVE